MIEDSVNRDHLQLLAHQLLRKKMKNKVGTWLDVKVKARRREAR
jgi:hypothetical protein